jgi:isoquinoline 1-oxidoreductase alpha subunit
MVDIGANPSLSFITMLSAVKGKEITTIEGQAEIGEDGQIVLHPVQQAFLGEQALQCSWCMSGQMMTAALLEANPSPDSNEILKTMNTVYCR